MRRIGLQLIAEKKEAVLAQSREKGRDIGRNDLKDRDLLTLLIKANLATDIPESQRLTDEEVLARTSLASEDYTPDLTFTACRGSYVSRYTTAKSTVSH